MKISVKQLKELIKEQVEEIAGKQMELDFSTPPDNLETRMNKLHALENELKAFDWYYNMSDDTRVMMNGSRKLSDLQDRASKLGHEGIQLLKRYSTTNGKGMEECGAVKENSNACVSNPPTKLDRAEPIMENSKVKITIKELKSLIKEQLEELEGEQQEFNFDRQESFDFPPSNAERRKAQKPVEQLRTPEEEAESAERITRRQIARDRRQFGLEEGDTSIPAEGGAVTGTQALAPAANVVKEKFNKEVLKLLKSL